MRASSRRAAARGGVLLIAVTSLLVAGCGGGGGEASPAPPATTATAATTAAAAGGSSAEGNAKLGEIVFVNEGCGNCHTLADAGVIGNIDDAGSFGPDLDKLKPSFDEVVAAVTTGKGAMPGFQGDISEQDIRDVAAYVSSVAGR